MRTRSPQAPQLSTGSTLVPSLRVSRKEVLEMEEGSTGLRAAGGGGTRGWGGCTRAALRRLAARTPPTPGSPGDAHRHSAVVVGGAVVPAGGSAGRPGRGRRVVSAACASARVGAICPCNRGTVCCPVRASPSTHPSKVKSCGRAVVIARLGGTAPLEQVRPVFQAPPAARTTASLVLFVTPAGAGVYGRGAGGLGGACRARCCGGMGQTRRCRRCACCAALCAAHP